MIKITLTSSYIHTVGNCLGSNAAFHFYIFTIYFATLFHFASLLSTAASFHFISLYCNLFYYFLVIVCICTCPIKFVFKTFCRRPEPATGNAVKSHEDVGGDGN